MNDSYHGISADDYIRRIDRILILTAIVTVALAVALILQIA